MKKIALLELQEHQEVLFGLLDLLVLQEVEIYVFAPQEMFEEWHGINQELIHWFTFTPKEPVPAFILRHKNLLDGLDLLFFTTLVRDFAFFARLSFRPPTLLLVHKGNTFFAPEKNIQLQNLADGLRYLRRLWHRENFYRHQLLNKINAFTFADDTIREHLQGVMAAKYRTLPAVPLASFTGLTKTQNYGVCAVIPGTVSIYTRDYDLLFAALQQVDQQLQKPLQLIFLGQARGVKAQQVLKLAERHSFQSIDIRIYTEVVSVKEYEHILSHADFLILPLREQIRFGLIREYYGKTSISGGLNDMLRFGKAALLPDFYPLSPDLDQLTHRYSQALELANLLLHWVNEQVYLDLATQAQPQLKMYSKARQSQRLWQILESLL